MSLRDYTPRLILHVLDSESKSVSFGWVLSLTTTALFVAFSDKFNADKWMNAQMVAAALVGGKVIKETLLGKVALKEGKPDAETPKP